MDDKNIYDVVYSIGDDNNTYNFTYIVWIFFNV